MGSPKRPNSGGSIYTLAQSGTQHLPNPAESPEVMVYGQGSALDQPEAWQNRARRKMITQSMILALIDIAKEKGDLERVQPYWNTYHCLNNVITSNGQVYSKYCKNRFCTSCCSIRKAEIINKYLPIIQTWEEPCFVTLTVKAQKASNLKKWMGGMKKAFNQILNRCKKRHQRGKGIKLVGIKSLECNFNPQKRTYNPHYHLIVANREIANLLVVEWQKQWNQGEKKLTSPFAQDVRKIDNLEGALIEIIKYGSKIFTEPDVLKKANKKIPPTIYAAALDNIFVAMQPYRLFDRFGFNLPKADKQKKVDPQFLQFYEEWEFDKHQNDWLNPDTGELLSGHVAAPRLKFLLSEHINLSVQ